jgi:AAA ATPase domain
MLVMAPELPNDRDFWRKLYTAFDPFRPLPAGDPAWVDCSAVRGDENVLRLGLEIERSPEVTCQLYSGHRGAGKSTELLRLQAELQKVGLQVVYFAVDDGDFESDDTQYSDILIACARQLIKALSGDLKDKSKFMGWVEKLFRDLQDLGLTELSLDEIGYETPESLLGKVSAKIKTNVGEKQKIRRAIENRADALIVILNELIGQALGDRSSQELVLIVDNLDRIVERYEGDGQPSNYEQIFVNHSEQLVALNCHVIYTIPISLAYSKHLTEIEERYKPVELLPMVMVRKSDGDPCDRGVGLLKEILQNRFRMAAAGLELADAFESADGLEQLCLMSGGHARNLMNLMKAALQHTSKLPITDRSVRRAISELRDTYRKVIDEGEWQLLARVAKDKMIVENNQQFRSLSFRRCILEYRYLDDAGEVQVWHDVHPLVRGLEGFQRSVKELG